MTRIKANVVIRGRWIAYSLVAWFSVGVLWLVATRGFHPSWELAVIVTASLVMAFAVAAYLNHLVLIPRLLDSRNYLGYAVGLVATMVVLTGCALAIIRVSYERMYGPDSDPNGLYKHFGIDLFGMAVHLLAAAGVVWLTKALIRRRGTNKLLAD